MKYRLCVVIINYMTVSLVKDCVDSLMGQLDFSRDCIVIVDNCSGGNDADELKSWLDTLEGEFVFISSPVNGGFSYGNNLGMQAVEADGYLLTNSDTIFCKEAVSRLIDGSLRNPEAGIIGPRLIDQNDVPQISTFKFPRPLGEFVDSADNSIVTRLLRQFVVPVPFVTGTADYEWISFASVLIKSRVIKDIGYMDDGYFMYYEDVDYCRRASDAGYKIMEIPESIVKHLEGQSSGMEQKKKARKKLPAYYYHSRARYYRKFYGLSGLVIANLLWCAGRPLSLLSTALTGKKKNFPKRKYWDIWKSGSVVNSPVSMTGEARYESEA